MGWERFCVVNLKGVSEVDAGPEVGLLYVLGVSLRVDGVAHHLHQTQLEIDLGPGRDLVAALRRTLNVLHPVCHSGQRSNLAGLVLTVTPSHASFLRE